MGAKVAIGANLRCKVEVRNFAKALVNAAAIDMVITDPAGVEVVSKTMVDITHEGLGLYYYSYKPALTAVTGTYCILWDVTYAGEHGIERGYFIVTE